MIHRPYARAGPFARPDQRAQPPIADYALLASCQSAALVSRDGSIDWCCFRRFDAPTCFARLLDWRRGGHFRIAPSTSYRTWRRYLPGTLILETRFQTESGEVVLTDLMPVRRTLGRVRPRAEVVRLLRCERGEVEIELELVPRFDYGLTGPRLEIVGPDLGIVYGGADALVVQSDLHMRAETGLQCTGKLLDTAWLYHRHGGRIKPDYWELLKGLVEVVAARWHEPDNSFWEFRDQRRQFVISKVMCWVAVDRAIRLAHSAGLDGDRARWVRLRDEIRDRIEREGVDNRSGTFVQAFGSAAPDATTLLIPLLRFLPGSDPRVKATLDRIERQLGADGLAYRYRRGDGLPGDEGAFIPCSFWMADNLAMIGEFDRARRQFEMVCGYANDVGLLSEEIDPSTGELLGNFPQAFSHAGLIGAAINLELARSVQEAPVVIPTAGSTP